MRLAWTLSIALHAAFFCCLAAQRTAPKRFSPPDPGGFRVGICSRPAGGLDTRGDCKDEWPAPPTETSSAEDVPDLPTFDLALAPSGMKAQGVRAECATDLLSPCAPGAAGTMRLSAPAATGARGALSVGAGSSGPPCARQNPLPAYPKEAWQHEWEGTVVLAVTVGADGRCKAVRVETPSGHRCLDDAAVEAVRSWVFAPATLDGAPVEAEIRQPIVFQMR